MTEQQAEQLKVGDVIQHAETGLHFVVINTTDETPQAIALIHLTDPTDFEAVKRQDETDA